MHPQIHQETPGPCPLCGMSLEPETMTAHEEENPEYNDMRRRFWMAFVFTIPIVTLEMNAHVFHLKINGTISNWIQFIVSIPVIFWGAKPFFERGLKSIKTHHLNMFTLISMGIGIAWMYSAIATFFPMRFPIAFRREGNIPLYFESASMITTLVLLGQVLELRARIATGGAIKALLKLTPEKARRILSHGTVEEIPLEQVHKGDLLHVRPGEKIPVDGELTEGHSYIDESMVTGEPIASLKKIGSKVIGGTLNQTGSFTFKALHVGKETMLARIIQMIYEAQRSKAPIQRLADTVSSWFVPIVILVAILSFIGWILWGPEPRFSHGLISAVSVLIIACPCALGLATPMSIMVGIGKGAAHGVLIKNAENLEQMEQVNLLVIDKTGTLTEGHPQLTEVITDEDLDEKEILTIAASLEQHSEHPLGMALLIAAQKKKLELYSVADFESFPGMGVSGKIQHRFIAIGTLSFVKKDAPAHPSLMKQAETLRSQGASVMYMSVNKQIVALFAVSDPIKKHAFEVIQQLHQAGVETCMLTGDNKKTAETKKPD